MSTLLKKLSTKTIMGEIKKPSLEEGVIRLYKVIGQASSWDEGSSQFGHYTYFEGIFRAVNLQSGEEFHGHKLFLPDVGSQIIKTALDARSESETAVFKFGFIVGIKYYEKGVGYEYVIEPLIKLKQDALEDIAAQCEEEEKKLLG